MDIIKARVVNDLLPAETDTEKRKQVLQLAGKLCAGLNADGAWPDVDYKDQSRSLWEAATHVSRLESLAMGIRLSPDKAEWSAKAGLALEYWLKQDLKNPNWWWNDIGVPMNLGEAMLLMEAQLTPAQKKAGCEILGRAGMEKTGQNRVWLSGIALNKACLENDPALAAKAVASIASTMRTDLDEGIQPDHSFYQHGACLYSGGYGLGLARDCARYVAYTQGTALAFPEAAQRALEGYILEGQQWLVRGDCFDPSACGREITRSKAVHKGRQVAAACALMASVAGPRQAEFAAAYERLKTGAVGMAGELSGNRYFWRSAFLVHRRPGYYFSVRMARTDLLAADGLINGENLRSHYLSDGVTYLMRSGTEYNGVFGVWDWTRVPGITLRSDAPFEGPTNTHGVRAFAGAANDGVYGVAAMDWANAEHGKKFPAGELVARKAWFCFDREIVCLGAGITGKAEHPVRTSLNQCLLNGAVALPSGAAAVGAQDLTGPTWVHHDGVGYLFPEKTAVHLAAGPQPGSWRYCTEVEPKKNITLPMFNFWIDHGSQPQAASYQYTLVPDITAKELPAYAKSAPVEVLSNTAAVQAVRHSALNIVMVAFFLPGTQAVAGALPITVDRSCIVLVRTAVDGTIHLAVCKPDTDPKQPGDLKVAIGDRAVTVKLPGNRENGRCVQAELPAAP